MHLEKGRRLRIARETHGWQDAEVLNPDQAALRDYSVIVTQRTPFGARSSAEGVVDGVAHSIQSGRPGTKRYNMPNDKNMFVPSVH